MQRISCTPPQVGRILEKLGLSPEVPTMKINAYITSTVADRKFVDVAVALEIQSLPTIRIRVA